MWYLHKSSRAQLRLKAQKVCPSRTIRVRVSFRCPHRIPQTSEMRTATFARRRAVSGTVTADSDLFGQMWRVTHLLALRRFGFRNRHFMVPADRDRSLPVFFPATVDSTRVVCRRRIDCRDGNRVRREGCSDAATLSLSRLGRGDSIEQGHGPGPLSQDMRGNGMGTFREIARRSRKVFARTIDKSPVAPTLDFTAS